jgi:hypothetical protein
VSCSQVLCYKFTFIGYLLNCLISVFRPVGDAATYAEVTDRRATQLLRYYFVLLFCINCVPSLTFFPSQQYKSVVESVTG